MQQSGHVISPQENLRLAHQMEQDANEACRIARKNHKAYMLARMMEIL